MRFRRFIALSLFFSMTGCVGLQDFEYHAAQDLRSHTAWWCCDSRCSDNPISDYSIGWRRGYSDVLLGGDGECPPVPPQRYWSHKFQSEAGECKIENWFLGYSHGAAAALASCRDHYNPVPISNTFRDCGPDCLPTDYAAYDFGKTTLGLRNPEQMPADADDDGTDSSAVPKAPSASSDYDSDGKGGSKPKGSISIDSPVVPPAPVNIPQAEPTPEPEPKPDVESTQENNSAPTPDSTSTQSSIKARFLAPGKWMRPASFTTRSSGSFFSRK